MGRITAVSKEVITNFYKNKINELRNSADIYKNDYIKYKLEEYYNDIDVIKARDCVENINKKYNKKFNIELTKWDIDYEKSNNYQMVMEEIDRIQKERDKFIMTLELYPKKQ